jgi:hypothetical protein
MGNVLPVGIHILRDNFQILEVPYGADVHPQTDVAVGSFAQHFIHYEGGMFRIVDKHACLFALHFNAHGNPFIDVDRGAGFELTRSGFSQGIEFMVWVGIILNGAVSGRLVIGPAHLGS